MHKPLNHPCGVAVKAGLTQHHLCGSLCLPGALVSPVSYPKARSHLCNASCNIYVPTASTKQMHRALTCLPRSLDNALFAVMYQWNDWRSDFEQHAFLYVSPHTESTLPSQKFTAADNTARVLGLVKGVEDAQDERFSSETAFPLYPPWESLHIRGGARPLPYHRLNNIELSQQYFHTMHPPPAPIRIQAA